MEKLKEALTTGSDTSVHLGGDYHAVKDTCHNVITIRKGLSPQTPIIMYNPLSDTLISPPPISESVTLAQEEFLNLAHNYWRVKHVVPVLDTMVPCYTMEDHQNQLGCWLCTECNPYQKMTM
jgi:hypothetical protein